LPIFSINQVTLRRNRAFFDNPDIERESFERAIGVLDEFHRKTSRPNN